MKVGNIVAGLEVVDVKRVNKLNLIQFLKEVDNYLQQGYKLDINSARQVGLVLQVDTYKTEAACSPKVGSTGVASTEVGSTGVKEETKVEEVVQEAQPEDTATKEVTTNVETETGTDTPVKKPTTTRSKKTATQ